MSGWQTFKLFIREALLGPIPIPIKPGSMLDFSHFTEVSPGRQAFLTGISPVPLPFKQPTDPAGKEDWQRGEAVVAVLTIASMAVDLAPMGPPGGGPSPAHAEAGGSSGAPVAQPLAPPVLVPPLVGGQTAEANDKTASPLAVLAANQPAAAQSPTTSDPKSADAKARSGSLRKRFMDAMLKKILANPKHLLRNLVDPTAGKWKGTSHLSEEAAVQAGHLVSRHSGEPERFALEDAFENQRANWRGEKQGAIFEREAVDIDGVPVEKVTAQLYEEQGVIPKGTVQKAPVSTGWSP